MGAQSVNIHSWVPTNTHIIMIVTLLTRFMAIQQPVWGQLGGLGVWLVSQAGHTATWDQQYSSCLYMVSLL